MRRSRKYVALLAGLLISASASVAQTGQQHDCRKEPAGGTPPWRDTAHCANKIKTFVWTGGSHTPPVLTYSTSGGVSVAVESKQFCYVRITVCGEQVVDQTTEVKPGTECPHDFAAPEVCCDEVIPMEEAKRWVLCHATPCVDANAFLKALDANAQPSSTMLCARYFDAALNDYVDAGGTLPSGPCPACGDGHPAGGPARRD